MLIADFTELRAAKNVQFAASGNFTQRAAAKLFSSGLYWSIVKLTGNPPNLLKSKKSCKGAPILLISPPPLIFTFDRLYCTVHCTVATVHRYCTQSLVRAPPGNTTLREEREGGSYRQHAALWGGEPMRGAAHIPFWGEEKINIYT